MTKKKTRTLAIEIRNLAREFGSFGEFKIQESIESFILHIQLHSTEFILLCMALPFQFHFPAKGQSRKET